MRRFDEIMRADGFEPHPKVEGDKFFRAIPLYKLDPEDYPELYERLKKQLNLAHIRFAPGEFHNDSNLVAHTSIYGVDVDGNLTGLDSVFNTGAEAEHRRFNELLQQRLADDPAFLQAFADQYAAVPRSDARSLEGDEIASLLDTSATYQQRAFVYSGSQPETVVMGDCLQFANNATLHRKKISDTFNPNAEGIMVGAYGTGEQGNATREAVAKAANENTSAGKETESTMTPYEALAYAEARAAASPEDEDIRKALEVARRNLQSHLKGW